MFPASTILLMSLRGVNRTPRRDFPRGFTRVSVGLNGTTEAPLNPSPVPHEVGAGIESKKRRRVAAARKARGIRAPLPHRRLRGERGHAQAPGYITHLPTCARRGFHLAGTSVPKVGMARPSSSTSPLTLALHDSSYACVEGPQLLVVFHYHITQCHLHLPRPISP